MADHPLRSATDRRLGGPLPRQPANQTRGHLEAINLWHKDHATPMRHAVLAVVSNCCPPLQGRFLTRYSPVRHFPLHPLDESSFSRFSFDLHVLSTPPAFVLSQDQTLYLKVRLLSLTFLLHLNYCFSLYSQSSYHCLLFLVRVTLVATLILYHYYFRLSTLFLSFFCLQTF